MKYPISILTWQKPNYINRLSRQSITANCPTKTIKGIESKNKKTVIAQTPKMSHKCFYCEKLFTTQQKREEHTLFHINLRIKCDQCNKTYSNHSNLHRHITTKHSNANYVPNTYREAGVNTLWSYTGQEYVCGQCRKFFSANQYDEYLKHIGEHNN